MQTVLAQTVCQSDLDPNSELFGPEGIFRKNMGLKKKNTTTTQSQQTKVCMEALITSQYNKEQTVLYLLTLFFLNSFYCQLHFCRKVLKIVKGSAPSFLQMLLLDFLVSVKAAPHECVIRTGQP